MKKHWFRSAVTEKSRGFSILLLAVAIAGLFYTPLVNGTLIATTTSYTTSSSTRTTTITFTHSNTTTYRTSTTTRVTTLTTVEVQRVIGYIGCSNTLRSVQGYQNVTAPDQQLFWNAYQNSEPTGHYNLFDGLIQKWDNPTSEYWKNYTNEVALYGQPKIVWVELCEGVDDPASFANVTTMLSILRSYSPNVVIYISPLNTYDPVGYCPITGPNGVQDATALEQEAVSAGLALQGPIMGPLNNSTTLSDHCHPNAAGKQILGQQLYQFFNNQQPSLSVSLVSPKNGTILTSSPVTLNVTVAGSIQKAIVTIFLDGNKICSGPTNAVGSLSCKHTVTKTGKMHSWYATATKTGFTPGTSPTWTFKY